MTAIAVLGLCFALLASGRIQEARSEDSGPPQDIVLMLDNSGSMRKNDPNFLTRVAVTTFLNSLHGDIQIAIIMFDQNVRVLMPLTQLNDATRQDFLTALDALNYRGLLTNSPAALEKSTYELRTKGRPDSQKSIIFMTDGIVDVGKDGFDEGDVEKARWMKSTLVDEAAKYQIRIYGIAYTDNADFELIQTLSSRTGGEYYRAASAEEIETVFDEIRTSLLKLSQQPGPEPVTPAEPDQAKRGDPPEQPEITPPDAADSGDTLPGVADSDDTLPGAADSGDTLPGAADSGDTLPGAADSDDTLPGAADSGDTLQGVADSDDTLPGAADSGDTLPGAADSGDTLPGTTGSETSSSGSNDPESSGSKASSETPETTAAAPEQNLPVAMLAGASALLLALIGIVLFLIKRKPATSTGVDPLMPKAFLNDVGNVTKQNSYELGGKPTIIGRLQGSDPMAANYIVIDESTIGRRHSLIEYKEHSFWVADQNSLNGTFVNNKRIETSTRLKHGDRLRFHRHEFEFLILDMFETDRTMMSQTVFAEISEELGVDEDDDATEIREPSAEDETIRRPDN